jgi:hypothetical protein
LRTAPRPGTLAIAVLRSYLPALVFVLLGAGPGAPFAFANLKLGPTGPRARVRREPYEYGLPSERPRGRYTVSFYLVGLMFLIFDAEVISCTRRRSSCATRASTRCSRSWCSSACSGSRSSTNGGAERSSGPLAGPRRTSRRTPDDAPNRAGELAADQASPGEEA